MSFLFLHPVVCNKLRELMLFTKILGNLYFCDLVQSPCHEIIDSSCVFDKREINFERTVFTSSWVLFFAVPFRVSGPNAICLNCLLKRLVARDEFEVYELNFALHFWIKFVNAFQFIHLQNFISIWKSIWKHLVLCMFCPNTTVSTENESDRLNNNVRIIF